MNNILILYPKEFNSRDKFERKVSRITKNIKGGSIRDDNFKHIFVIVITYYLISFDLIFISFNKNSEKLIMNFL